MVFPARAIIASSRRVRSVQMIHPDRYRTDGSRLQSQRRVSTVWSTICDRETMTYVVEQDEGLRNDLVYSLSMSSISETEASPPIPELNEQMEHQLSISQDEEMLQARFCSRMGAFHPTPIAEETPGALEPLKREETRTKAESHIKEDPYAKKEPDTKAEPRARADLPFQNFGVI